MKDGINSGESRSEDRWGRRDNLNSMQPRRRRLRLVRKKQPRWLECLQNFAQTVRVFRFLRAPRSASAPDSGILGTLSLSCYRNNLLDRKPNLRMLPALPSVDRWRSKAAFSWHGTQDQEKSRSCNKVVLFPRRHVFANLCNSTAKQTPERK